MNIDTLSNNQMTSVQTSTPPAPIDGADPPVVQPQTPVSQPAAPVATTAPTTTGADYVGVSGDTFAAIAHRQHVSVKALIEANPGVDARKLRVGQKIQVPGSSRR